MHVVPTEDTTAGMVQVYVDVSFPKMRCNFKIFLTTFSTIWNYGKPFTCKDINCVAVAQSRVYILYNVM